MGEVSGVFGTLDVTVVGADIAVDGDLLIADGADTTQGTTTDAAVTDPTASASVVAALKGDLKLTGALTETAPATDTASSGLNGRLQRIAQRLTSIFGGTGAAADAAVTNPASSGSIVALLKGLISTLRSGQSWTAVTPDDATAIVGHPTRALWVGTGGNIVIVDESDNAVAWLNVPDGTLLDVAAKRVNDTNTTADDIVAIF